jgi:hypothetical protein
VSWFSSQLTMTGHSSKPFGSSGMNSSSMKSRSIFCSFITARVCEAEAPVLNRTMSVPSRPWAQSVMMKPRWLRLSMPILSRSRTPVRYSASASLSVWSLSSL